MNEQLQQFIENAKQKGLDDQTIRTKLITAGWPEQDVNQALMPDDLQVPLPPAKVAGHTKADTLPISLNEQGRRVKVFEYHIMFLTLWIAVIAIVWIINVFLFTSSRTFITFPLTALLVSLPLVLILFFRLGHLEDADPDLKLLPERLRMVQSTQSLSFIVLLVHTIFALYQILSGSHSAGQQALSWCASLIIFGGLFAYYWQDTHKK